MIFFFSRLSSIVSLFLCYATQFLICRLSKIASDKLTDGNPNFANLSDKNRPTKIGEKFGQMYDDEWSEAFDEIKRTSKKEDAEVYEILLNIVLVRSVRGRKRERKNRSHCWQSVFGTQFMFAIQKWTAFFVCKIKKYFSRFLSL